MTNSQKSFIAFTLLLALGVATVLGQTGRGYNAANMDKNTSACADFYQYANGTWLKNTEIPAAYSAWGSFNILAENNRKTLHEILEEAAKKTNAAMGSNEQKIGDFYASCLDESDASGRKLTHASRATRPDYAVSHDESGSVEGVVAKLLMGRLPQGS